MTKNKNRRHTYGDDEDVTVEENEIEGVEESVTEDEDAGELLVESDKVDEPVLESKPGPEPKDVELKLPEKVVIPASPTQDTLLKERPRTGKYLS